MEQLEWIDIKGADLSKYEICPTGVRTKKTGYIHKFVLRGRDEDNKYYCVKLSNDKNESKYYPFHRLLELTYNTDNNKYGQIVNHKDEDKLNDSLENLEWVDSKENANYGTRNERILNTRREKKSSNAEKSVNCILNGKVINTYKSISEAGRCLGLNFSNIAACCRGVRKTCGGYSWEVVKPLNN